MIPEIRTFRIDGGDNALRDENGRWWRKKKGSIEWTRWTPGQGDIPMYHHIYAKKYVAHRLLLETWQHQMRTQGGTLPMQRIEDLTKLQLLALTDEQIKRYIDVKCLEQGVALLPAEEPVRPKVTKPEPDQTIYKVGNFEFETEDDAMMVLKAVLAAKRVSKRYNNINGETFYTIAEPYSHDRPGVDTEKGFSPHAWIDAQQQAKEYAEQFRVYKDLKKDWDAAVEGRREIETEVWDLIREARDEAARRNRYIDTFQQYLEIADGDEELAWKFFVKAHPAAEDIDGLKDELVPETEAEYAE